MKANKMVEQIAEVLKLRRVDYPGDDNWEWRDDHMPLDPAGDNLKDSHWFKRCAMWLAGRGIVIIENNNGKTRAAFMPLDKALIEQTAAAVVLENLDLNLAPQMLVAQIARMDIVLAMYDLEKTEHKEPKH